MPIRMPPEERPRTIEQLIDDLIRPGFWDEDRRALKQELVARIRRGDFVEDWPLSGAVADQLVSDHPGLVVKYGADGLVRQLCNDAAHGRDVERALGNVKRDFELSVIAPVMRAMVSVMRRNRGEPR